MVPPVQTIIKTNLRVVSSNGTLIQLGFVAKRAIIVEILALNVLAKHRQTLAEH
jgi:hypothetical protein